MASNETKTLKLSIQADTVTATDALKAVTKSIEGTDISLKTLKTSMQMGTDGVKTYSHSVELLATSLSKLQAAQKTITNTLEFPAKVTSTGTSDVLKERLATAQGLGKEALAATKQNIQDRLAVLKAGEDSILAVKVRSAEQQRTLESELQAKLKDIQTKYSEGTLNRGLQSSIDRTVASYATKTLKIEESARKEIVAIKEVEVQEKASASVRLQVQQHYIDVWKSKLAEQLAAKKAAEAELLATEKAANSVELQLQQHYTDDFKQKLAARAARRKADSDQAIAEATRVANFQAAVAQSRKGYAGTSTNELISQTKASIQQELAAAQYGADSREAIRAKSAEKERLLTAKMYSDMAALSKQYEKGTIGKLEFKVAGANVLNQYKKDMLELAPSVDRVHESHKAMLYTLTKMVVAYRAVGYTFNQVASSIGSITKVGIELDATKASLIATTGSTMAMEGSLRFLDAEAQRTGITIGVLRENFRNFQASTSLAGATTQQTLSMFTKLNTVITALHLSTDKAQGVFTAITQIFNKSKVQSEELVKQLGNLLPGAFASFAASMKISTEELAKQMKAGTVYAQDTMENFIDYMANRFQPAFLAAQDGLNANWGRFETSVSHLKEVWYASSSGILNDTVKFATKMVDSFANVNKATNETSHTLGYVFDVAMAITITRVAQVIASFTALRTATMLANEATVALIATTRVLQALTVVGLVAGVVELGRQLYNAATAGDNAVESLKKLRAEDEAYRGQKIKALTQAGRIEISVEDDKDVKTFRTNLENTKTEVDNLAKIVKKNKVDMGFGITTDRTTPAQREELKASNARLIEVEHNLAVARETARATLTAKENETAAASFAAKMEKQTAKQEAFEAMGLKADRSEADALKRKTKAAQEALNQDIKDRDAAKKALQEAIKAQSVADYPESKAKEVAEAQAFYDKISRTVEMGEEAKGKIAAKVREEWQNKEDAANKKGASSAKTAARERLAGIKEDIDVESQFAKTLEQKRREELDAIDTLNSKTIISYEDFAARKLKVLTESYEKEKKIYEEQKRQAEGSGNKKMAATADQNLERLTSAFKADTKSVKVDEEGSLKDFKTTLADIHGQYQDILGVERDTDDLTKQRLVDLRARLVAEIEEKGILSDVSAERLKEFDITRKLEASQRQYKILMEETRVINDKHGEALTRNQALNQAGLISDYEKARLNTIANKERIKGLEDAIRKEEELIATSKNPQSASATENIRKMRAELENLKLSADEVGIMVENSLGNAFESSFQGLITGTMSAKQAFSNFATSVVADIAKIVAQEVKSAVIGAFIRPLINAGLGALGNAFGGAGTTIGGSGVLTQSQMPSNTYMTPSVANIKLANGGTMSGAGISAYSGTIVDKPTLFPFAKGTGLMGEAGAEAILPLKRNSQGKLGVSAENSGQAAKSNVYYINTTVNAGSNASPTDIANKTSESLMRAIAKQEISTAARPGNQLNRSSKFG
jgi:tape measure domain-containing protein